MLESRNCSRHLSASPVGLPRAPDLVDVGPLDSVMSAGTELCDVRALGHVAEPLDSGVNVTCRIGCYYPIRCSVKRARFTPDRSAHSGWPTVALSTEPDRTPPGTAQRRLETAYRWL